MATVAKPTAPTRQIGAPPMVPRIAPREDLNPFRIAQIQFDMAAESARCEIGRGTRLNSSHGYISYAVFCLKKKYTALQNRAPCGDTNLTISPGTSDKDARYTPTHFSARAGLANRYRVDVGTRCPVIE